MNAPVCTENLIRIDVSPRAPGCCYLHRARATAEYLAQFRTDVEGFVALEIVEGCVGDYREQLPARGTHYGAFVDPAGGSGPDAMTLAIAHKARPDDRIIIDAVREMRPPFSPTVVVDEFAELLKAYDVTKVVGDHYGGEFVKEPFRKHGISYELCKQPKSDLYKDLSPRLNSGQIVLPHHNRLVAQICGLETAARTVLIMRQMDMTILPTR